MAKTRRAKPRKPGITELLQRADMVYQGALAVIRKNGIVRAKTEVAAVDLPAYKKASRKVGIANQEIIAYAKAHATLKKTHLIRAVALEFPTASVAEIRASLPGQKPATVGIQTRWAREGRFSK